MIDQMNIFSDKQDLAQVAGTYKSTNPIDLGAPGTDQNGNLAPHDIGQSDPAINAYVTEAFTSAGAATLQVQLCAYDDVARTANRTVLTQTDVIAKAALVKGYRIPLKGIPPRTKQRVLSVEYVIGTATTTAGKITAYVGSHAYA